MKWLHVLIISISFLSLTACASHKTIQKNDPLDDELFYEEEVIITDPLEDINRMIFNFNDFFYVEILSPISNGYVFITPSFFRTGVNNALHNLSTPVRFIGSLLQLKGQQAAIELGEFIINSTFGIGGLFVIADEEVADEEDIGQALGYWGVPTGPYLVLPFFGPSNIRDGIGLIGNIYTNPISYIGDMETSLLIYSEKELNDWSLHPDRYNSIVGDAFDPYIALRSAFSQNRESRINK